MRFILLFLFMAMASCVIATSIWPALDLKTAALFFDPFYTPVDPNNRGFYWRELAIPNFMHEAIQIGSRILAVALVIAVVINWQRKAALFLLVTLIIGPGLLTNTVLKDNWGRARPVQVQEFGGSATFTPPLQIAEQCDRNCSFVSGDGSLGFFLHSFFYVAPPAQRRRVLLAGLVLGGGIFGGLRIAMGAHFLSDVLWGGLLMLLVSAIMHAAFYGRAKTKACWQEAFRR